MVSRSRIEMANKRAEQLRKEFPHAESVRYDRRIGKVVIELSSKLTLSFSPQDAQGLEHAKAAELEDVELSPSGFGVHFPKLDADLYIPAMLEGLMGSKNWMAARLGQVGGQSRSRAKKAASRANGKLGGRPRRAAAGD